MITSETPTYKKILYKILDAIKKFFTLDKTYIIGIAIASVLLVVDILVAILVGYRTEHKYIYDANVYVIILILSFILYLFRLFLTKKKSSTDLIIVILAFFLIWDLSYKLGLITNDILIPSPEGTFHVFEEKSSEIINDIFSSLTLLFWGFLLGIVLGTLLGLVAGWFSRVRDVVIPISNAITLIPPLLFSAYLIMLLPTFKDAAIAIIFFAVFWPTLNSTIARVKSIDKKIIEAAKVMGVSNVGMLYKVIFPYCLPGIIQSISKSLRGAFMCLAGAEMLGINGGVGYFVEKYKSFADYRVVLAGIIVIGFITTIIDIIVQMVERKVIRWT